MGGEQSRGIKHRKSVVEAFPRAWDGTRPTIGQSSDPTSKYTMHRRRSLLGLGCASPQGESGVTQVKLNMQTQAGRKVDRKLECVGAETLFAGL